MLIMLHYPPDTCFQKFLHQCHWWPGEVEMVKVARSEEQERGYVGRDLSGHLNEEYKNGKLALAQTRITHHVKAVIFSHPPFLTSSLSIFEKCVSLRTLLKEGEAGDGSRKVQRSSFKDVRLGQSWSTLAIPPTGEHSNPSQQ